jgi:hypothetical protein
MDTWEFHLISFLKFNQKSNYLILSGGGFGRRGGRRRNRNRIVIIRETINNFGR